MTVRGEAGGWRLGAKRMVGGLGRSGVDGWRLGAKQGGWLAVRGKVGGWHLGAKRMVGV